MTRPPGRSPETPGDSQQPRDQFAFEVAQEIGVDLGKVDPQKTARLEKRLHRKGKRRS